MKLSIRNLMWWLVVSISAIVGAYGIYTFDGIQYILTTDQTPISLAIYGLYIATTIVLGYFLHFKDEIDLDKFWFVANSVLELGLIGTLVGFMITFSIFVFGEGITNDNIKEMSQYIAAGAGAAITTTFSGLVCAFFLKCQLAVVERAK